MLLTHSWNMIKPHKILLKHGFKLHPRGTSLKFFFTRPYKNLTNGPLKTPFVLPIMQFTTRDFYFFLHFTFCDWFSRLANP